MLYLLIMFVFFGNDWNPSFKGYSRRLVIKMLHLSKSYLDELYGPLVELWDTDDEYEVEINGDWLKAFIALMSPCARGKMLDRLDVFKKTS
jgi:hypothetical protein